MRLYLLPISTRRTLIYCQRLNVTTAEQTNFAARMFDKGTAKAADMWASWEKKESGWQKWVADKGNSALKRIPYEEWGLKSIPPLSARRKTEELKAQGKGDVEVLFPRALIPEGSVMDVLGKLGTERQSLHQRNMVYCIIGMPVVAPFALVPIIPNLPFFYLVYRAWSHWKALSGSKHLQFLVDKNLVTSKPSKILDELYATGKRPFATVSTSEKTSTDPIDVEEKMVLHQSDGKRIAEALGMPELDMELDRAVWQVEKALKANKDLKDEKEHLDSANAEAKKEK